MFIPCESREGVRLKYGIVERNPSLLKDMCTACFCGPCATCQALNEMDLRTAATAAALAAPQSQFQPQQQVGAAQLRVVCSRLRCLFVCLFVLLFVCLFVCFIGSQHTLNQLRLQQYTTPTIYVISKLPSPHCPALRKSRTLCSLSLYLCTRATRGMVEDYRARACHVLAG